MMRHDTSGIVLLASVALAGCSLLNPPAVVEKRFAKASYAADPTPQVGIAVSTAPAEAKEGAGDSGAGRVVVHKEISRGVVIAIRPKSFAAPGDRVEAARISIQVAPGQKADWKITSWTQATNGSTSIEVGKLTQETSSKFTAETGLKVSPALPDAKVGFEANRSKTQEADIKDVTTLSAAVDENGVAWLDETAGWRDNLATNLAISVVISANPTATGDSEFVALSGLTKDGAGASKKTQFAPAAEVRLLQTDTFATTAPTKPVCGLATLEYERRHVAKGADTFSESDDEVVFNSGKDAVTFVLAPPPFEPGYGLQLRDLNVHYQIGGRKPAVVRFATLAEALAFRDWLYAVKPVRGEIGAGGYAFKVGVLNDNLVLRALTDTDLSQLFAGLLDVEMLRQSQINLAAGCHQDR